MNIELRSLDWALIQAFCTVAEEGSLSAAGRRLGQSQPTMGRHIKSIELALGVELFHRVPRGLALTHVGLEILNHAQEMERAAAGLCLAAEGQAVDLRGTVRITASVVFSHFILPPVIAQIRTQLPEIDIELVPSDTTENLIFREADIAIRMYRPTQLDVITSHVADQEIGLYVSRTYLERVGKPTTMEDALALDFVGFDRNDLIIRSMTAVGQDVDRDFFPVRCDDQAAYWHLVKAGCGIGATQKIIGDAEPLVERILPGIELDTLPIWLTAPEALRSNARIRKVWDILAQALANLPNA
ncbi:MAG: LysR family transcriptional regulator [Paracoccaceae bacterium]